MKNDRANGKQALLAMDGSRNRRKGDAARQVARSAVSAAGPQETANGSADPAFEHAYAQMMARALAESRGERKRRLQEEHGHAERMLAARVLWPAFGNLDHLHPEYEIRDIRGGVNFVDYAYMPSRQLELLLECDGFGPHWRDISRWQFDRNEERQNLLLLDEWRMLRFSYDAVMERTERCQQTVLLALAKWGQEETVRLGVYERAIMHFSLTCHGEKITPSLVAQELEIHRHTAMTHMRSLEEKGLLTPLLSPTGRRVGYTIPNQRPKR
ncbi:MarR family transcriptional regulator [Cohnella lubricantis]|uniref:DNA-binding response regulator n=1 Tax=Cohnella lubricantis TaxID=2163172 RepID=A0A841TFL0_9BACL|nr:MarR family transcriptional regulator [Cohnella lubricantis]MBB6679802.1 DNA-binding response regulator [Cohnella lubricantis]MBP2119668.1 very-short-patch-repair endonuclease [Cohnella lubricantis]